MDSAHQVPRYTASSNASPAYRFDGADAVRAATMAALQSAPPIDSPVTTPTAPKPPTASQLLSYTVECYENERWFPVSGWCTKRLPTDRPHFSSKDGNTAFDPITWPLPAGYDWVGSWSIDKEHPGGVDSEGWRYAFAWGTHFKPRAGASSYVRRRRWIRTMIRLPNAPSSSALSASSETLPAGVVAVTNEAFDLCNASLSAAEKRIPSIEEAAPSACASAAEANLDYFASRQATASVIGRMVRKDGRSGAEVVGDLVAPAVVAVAPDCVEIRTGAVPAPVSAIGVEFVLEAGDDEDDDTRFYGFRSSAPPSACNRVGGDGGLARAQAELEEYTFQKTLSEIVEEADRMKQDGEEPYQYTEPPPSVFHFTSSPGASTVRSGRQHVCIGSATTSTTIQLVPRDDTPPPLPTTTSSSPPPPSAADDRAAGDDDDADFSDMLRHFVSRASAA